MYYGFTFVFISDHSSHPDDLARRRRNSLSMAGSSSPQKNRKSGKSFVSNSRGGVAGGIGSKQRQHLLEVDIVFQGISISVFDSEPAELIHMSLQGIMASYVDTGEDFILEAAIQRIQLDNQLPGGVEVILQPTPIPAESAGSGQPFLQLIAIRHKHIGASHYRHFEILIQEMELYLEEAFLRRWYDFARSLLKFGQFSTAPEDLAEPTDEIISKYLVARKIGLSPGGGLYKLAKALMEPTSSDVIYLEKLFICSVRINFSFSRGTIAHKDTSAIAVWLDAIGMVIPRIDRAPIRLNLLEMNNVFSSPNVLLSSIVTHYKGRLIIQGMKVFGYADFLGNPISVVSSLGQGVKDFFIEPRDALLHDPSQFGKGVLRGTASLVRNTVKGVSTFGSTLTGSMGTGLALISMDSEYAARREKEKYSRPENLGQGIAQG
jgi:vacuolar protein sorting-associated protein 13A/C